MVRKLLAFGLLSLALDAAGASSRPSLHLSPIVDDPVIVGQVAVGGRVVGPNGRGIAGARVELRPVLSRYEQGAREAAGTGEPAAMVAGTGADGGFEILAPGAGMWTVTVAAAGYVPVETCLLPLREAVILPDAQLRRDAGLRVRIEDADGHPLFGARVRAAVVELPWESRLWLPLPAAWQPAARSAVTGKDGSVRLARGADETLRLWAVAPGHRLGELGGAVTRATIRLPAGAPRRLFVEEMDGGAAAGVVVREAASGLVLAAVLPGRRRAGLGVAEETSLLLETADGRRVTVPPARRLAGTTTEKTVTRVRLPRPAPRDGRVLEAGTRHRLAGADVWPADDPGAAVTSDAAGVYRIERSAAVAAGLSAAAAGHCPAARTAARDAAPDLPTLSLAAAATVTGTVVDERGAPVAGAALEARPMDEIMSDGSLDQTLALTTAPERARTGADGTFRLGGLTTEGNYWLTTGHPGFAADGRNLPRGRSLPTALRIVLRRGLTVKGRAVDETGRPVAGATVTLPAQEAGFQAETAADGTFLFSDLSAGQLLLNVKRPGAVPFFRAGLEIRLDRSNTETLDLGDIVLPGGAPLRGRFLDSAGHPLSGVKVWVQLRSPGITPWSAQPDAVTGEDGRFAVIGIAPHAGLVLDACRDGLGSEEIRLPESPPEPLDLVLRPVGRIAGRVLGPDGAPVAAVQVEAGREGAEEENGLPQPCPTGAAVLTDAAGRFAFEGLRTGPHFLAVDGGSGPQIEGLEVPAAEEIEITMDEEEMRSFEQRPGPEPSQPDRTPVYPASGHVMDEAGAPIAGAVVDDWWRRRSVSSAADGSFTIEIPAEKTQLSVWAEGYAAIEVYLTGAPGDGVEIRLPREVTVTGRLLGLSPEELRWAHWTGAHLGTVEPDGAFRLLHQGPGPTWLNAEVGDRIARRLVEIPAGVGEASFDLEFPPVSEIRGRITGPDGEPAAGAEIRLVQDRATETAKPLPDGTFVLRLPAGAWTGTVSAGGYVTATLEIDGSATGVEIRLERAEPPADPADHPEGEP